MAKYLSQEWLDLGKSAVNNNSEFRRLAKGIKLTIYHVIKDFRIEEQCTFGQLFGMESVLK